MATVTLEDQPDRVAEAEAADRPAEAVAEVATASRMFKFSRYLHIGPGAEECEEGETGDCNNPLHFHAWLRLPNKFQQKDLHAKGLAAKARRMRAARNPETGAYAVLEEQLEQLRDDGNLEVIVEQIVSKEWVQDYFKAVTELGEREEWALIDQDRERYTQLAETELTKPEDERGEEFTELESHIGTYLDALRAKVEELQEPKKVALAELGLEGALDHLRKQRIEQVGDAAFAQTYDEWMWFIGTLRPKPGGAMPHERVWTTLGTIEDPQQGAMWAAAPEVLEAVEQAFKELDEALRQGARGNS